MYKYRVIASDSHSGIVALADDGGKCHLGKALQTVPAVEAELCGDAPAVGVRHLRLVPSDVPCLLVLVLLSCDAQAASRLTVLPKPGRAPMLISTPARTA